MAFTRKKFALGFEFPEAYFRIVDYYENETGLVVTLEVHSCKDARESNSTNIGIEYIYFHALKKPTNETRAECLAFLYTLIQEKYPESEFIDDI